MAWTRWAPRYTSSTPLTLAEPPLTLAEPPLTLAEPPLTQVGAPLEVMDARGAPLATLWLSAAANASLARLCPPELLPSLPPPAARIDARQVGARRLASVLRLQAC